MKHNDVIESLEKELLGIQEEVKKSTAFILNPDPLVPSRKVNEALEEVIDGELKIDQYKSAIKILKLHDDIEESWPSIEFKFSNPEK